MKFLKVRSSKMEVLLKYLRFWVLTAGLYAMFRQMCWKSLDSLWAVHSVFTISWIYGIRWFNRQSPISLKRKLPSKTLINQPFIVQSRKLEHTTEGNFWGRVSKCLHVKKKNDHEVASSKGSTKLFRCFTMVSFTNVYLLMCHRNKAGERSR